MRLTSDFKHHTVPSCLLVTGLFSLALWQAQPTQAASTTPVTESARRSGQATVYFVDAGSGAVIGSQTLTAGGALTVPAGYQLSNPSLAANIQTTLAQGFSTSVTLKITKPTAPAMNQATAPGTETSPAVQPEKAAAKPSAAITAESTQQTVTSAPSSQRQSPQPAPQSPAAASAKPAATQAPADAPTAEPHSSTTTATKPRQPDHHAAASHLTPQPDTPSTATPRLANDPQPQRQDAQQPADPFAREELVPWANEPDTVAEAQQPSGHTLIHHHAKPTLNAAVTTITTTPAATPPNPVLLQPKVIFSHSQRLPQGAKHHGGGDPRAGLAAYFVALSGKINFGIRATSNQSEAGRA